LVHLNNERGSFIKQNLTTPRKFQFHDNTFQDGGVRKSVGPKEALGSRERRLTLAGDGGGDVLAEGQLEVSYYKRANQSLLGAWHSEMEKWVHEALRT